MYIDSVRATQVPHFYLSYSKRNAEKKKFSQVLNPVDDTT